MSRMMDRHKRRHAATTPGETGRNLKESAPKSAARKQANESTVGQYVTLNQTDRNTLEITPNPEKIQEFVADNRDHLSTDILLKLADPGEENLNERRYNVWGDDKTLALLLKDIIDYHGWQWVRPEEIAALTDAPILEAPDGRIYWHERYQKESAAEELILGKIAKFDGAPENKRPAPKLDISIGTEPQAEEVMDEPQGKQSSKKIAVEEPIPDASDAPVEAPAVPHAAPVAAPSANPYKDWKTENLIETIESLTKQEDFPTAKPEQKAVEQMAEVLSARPVEQEQLEAKTSALHKAASVSGFPPVNSDTGSILEGDKSITNGHEHQEDNTGITVPATELPSKFAAAMTTGSALKKVETLADKLKALYLDAKPISGVNESRPVREAIESIYHAMTAMGEAQKALLKQQQQEEEEAAAQEVAAKKKSSNLLSNLKLAAAEDSEETAEETEEEPAQKESSDHPRASSSIADRKAFRSLVASKSPLANEAASEIANGILRSGSGYRSAHHAGDTARKAAHSRRIASLATQLGMTASEEATTIRIAFADGEGVDVPTADTDSK